MGTLCKTLHYARGLQASFAVIWWLLVWCDGVLEVDALVQQLGGVHGVHVFVHCFGA